MLLFTVAERPLLLVVPVQGVLTATPEQEALPLQGMQTARSRVPSGTSLGKRKGVQFCCTCVETWSPLLSYFLGVYRH